MWCGHTHIEGWVVTLMSCWWINLLIMQKNGCENEYVHLFWVFEENSVLAHPTLDGLTTYWMKLTYHNKNFFFFFSHPCISCFQASFQCSNSHDKVRKIVAEEGRTARNLIAWSVPLENKDDDGMCWAVFHQLFPLPSLCPLDLLTWKHVFLHRISLLEKTKVMFSTHSIIVKLFSKIHPAVDRSLHTTFTGTD